MNAIFEYCISLVTTEGLQTWDTSKLIELSRAFFHADKLVDFKYISEWNISNVTTISLIFGFCSLENVDSLRYWDVSNVRNFDNAFYSCYLMKNIKGLTNWNIQNAESLSGLFKFCGSLENLKPLTYWDTSNVINMSSTFQGCKSLKSLKGLEYWNVSKVKSMAGTFSSCTGITSTMELSNWDVSNVHFMSNMFRESGIEVLKGLEHWDVSNVKDMSEMFIYCSNIYNVYDLRYWNIEKVVNVTMMFAYCNIPSVLCLNNWNVSKLRTLSKFSKYVEEFNHTIQDMFKGCHTLESISDNGLEYFKI